MRCKKARIMISAALDGELLQSQQAALVRHISSCKACAGEKAALYALRDTMSRWSDEEPSTWLAESFAYKLRQLKEQPVEKARRPGWVLGTAGAGLATAMLALVFLMHSQVQPPAPVSAPEHVAVVKEKPVKQPAQPEIVVKPIRTPVIKKPVATPAPKIRRVAPKPAYVARTVEVTPVRRTNGNIELESRSAKSLRSAEHAMSEPVVMASITKEDATSPVTDNLGEAGLAMNETIERVRGTLRKAADMMAAQYTEPAVVSDPDGGEIL